MTEVMMNREIYEQIEDLMLAYRITEKDVHNCYIQHKNRIDSNDMIDNFVSENAGDRQFAMKTVSVLSRDKRDEVMAFFCKEYGLDQTEHLHGDFLREDVVLIFTACLYNPTFRDFAQSICDSIQNRIEKERPPIIVFPVGEQNTGGFELFSMPEAAAKAKGARLFGFRDYVWNGIPCKEFCIDRKNGKIEYQFQINNIKEHKNLDKLRLKLSIFNQFNRDVLLRDIPLYLNESMSTEESLVYTTGIIPIVEREAEAFISEITEDING